MGKFTDKTVIITGGNSGVGAATAMAFAKDGANVIAYGEKIFTEAVGGESSMVQFEIPLNYVRTDIKPSNIIITCSASQYGDYYSGGPSVMYLDDFELVY